MMPVHFLGYAAAAVVLVLSLDACGSTGVTGSGTTGDSNASSQLALAECMRKHGVPNFPDPTFPAAGGIAESAGTSINRNSPAFQKAIAVCNGRSS